MVEAYLLLGRHEEAERLFERLCKLSSDVGLLSEEYDPKRRRLLGNFPQALSHVSLVNSAHKLIRAKKPSEHSGGSFINVAPSGVASSSLRMHEAPSTFSIRWRPPDQVRIHR
jgi:hypothetical protein